MVDFVFLKNGQYIKKNTFQRTNHPKITSQIWWLYKTNKFIGPATTVRRVKKCFKEAESIKKNADPQRLESENFAPLNTTR